MRKSKIRLEIWNMIQKEIDIYSEFKVTPYSNGTGYKMDYYGNTTYNNESHNSIHGKVDLNGNYDKTINDRDHGTQDYSSGSGWYKSKRSR